MGLRHPVLLCVALAATVTVALGGPKGSVVTIARELELSTYVYIYIHYIYMYKCICDDSAQTRALNIGMYASRLRASTVAVSEYTDRIVVSTVVLRAYGCCCAHHPESQLYPYV